MLFFQITGLRIFVLIVIRVGISIDIIYKSFSTVVNNICYCVKFKFHILLQYDHIAYTKFDNVHAQKYQKMEKKSHNNEGSSMQADMCNGGEEQHLDYNKHFLLRLDSTDSPVMPWFGMDIGGTLVKLVYFEPKQDSHSRHYNDEERKTSANIQKHTLGWIFLKSYRTCRWW